MRCKFCSKTFVGTRKYFEHVRQEHIKTRTATTEVQDVEPTIDSQPENDMDNAKPTVKQFKKLKIKLGPTELQPYLEIFYPNCINNAMNPKKKYVCASCKLNFNLLGLYDHMKKIHNGLLCQFCLKLFKTFSEIEKHLRVVHKVPKWYFHNPKMFLSYAGHNYDFVCSVCSESLSGKEIESHRCNKVGPKVFECPNCGETFSNQRRLEVHMSNGWCKLGGKKPGLGLGFERLDDEKECATRFKVLSGQEPNFLLLPPPKPAKPAAPKEEAPKKFSVADRQILNKFSQASKQKTCDSPEFQVLKDLPETGNIFCGKRAPGVNSKIRKEIKESGYNWKFSDAAEIFRAGVSFFLDSKLGPSSSRPSTEDESSDTDFGRKTGRDDTMSDDDIHPGEDAVPSRATESELTATDVDVTQEEKISAKFQGQNVSLKITLPPKKESKSDRIARQKIEIRESLEKIREVIESNEGCLFCQQSRVVTVDAIFLLSHLIIVHDRENVEKILGESAEATILRMRMNIKDTRKDEIIFRYKRFDSDEVSSSYSCCYCSLVINDYEDLFSHLDSAHGSKVLNCHLCQNIFLNYGSFVSHVCFGPMQQQLTAGKPRAKFVCPACDRDSLKTFLEFQFHVRKHHNICEICLMPSESQATLFQHCLTHNQELMCMKCFLTFDTLDQFRKHLFYQHEAEHTLCKECHQKSWPHVYHFCVRPDSVTCEVCDKKFHNIGQYRVHMRTHTKTNPYSCSVRSCHKSYISKQLLLKHQVRRHPDLRATASKALEERRNHRLLSKFGAKDLHSIQMAELIIDDLVRLAVAHSEEQPDQEEPEKMGDPENNTKPETSTYLDPIDAAVRSIMGPDSFDLHLSPTKAFSNIIQPHLTPPRSTSPPQNLPPTSPQSVVAPVNGISNTNKSLPDETTDVVPNLVSKAPQTETEKNTDESKVECPRDVAHHKLSNGHVTAAMDSSAEKSDNDLSPKAAAAEPVMGGIWNQDLFFLSKTEDQPPKKGCKIMKPKYPMTSHESQSAGLRSLQPVSSYVPSHAKPQPLINFDAKTISKKLGTGGWDVLLSENSDSDNEGTTPKVRIVERLVIDKRISMKDHDYCYDAYMTSQRPPTPPPAPIQVAPSEDLSEMDKIANNVAMGVAFDNNTSVDDGKKKQKKKKDKKKKKKKRHKKDRSARDSSSSDSEMDQDPPLIKLQPLAASTPAVPVRKGPKPKYHTSMTGRGVTAGAARPRFSDSSDEEVSSNNGLSDLELASSDLDTDFSADEKQPVPKRPAKPTAKAAALKEGDKPDTPKSSTIKLKIKLTTNSTLTSNVSNLDQSRKKSIRSSKKRRKSKLKSSTAKQRKTDHYGFSEFSSVTESKRKSFSTSESDSETESVFKENIGHNDGVDSEPNEKLYCVCQCPYDEVSEMIACDAPDCRLEWFHFECVGIMVAPEGQWYCPECTQRYGIKPRTCV